MQALWMEELTTEEETELVEKAAQAIHKRGLETPAILFFEMHKPLAGLVGQSMVMFSPFIIPFSGFDGVNDYSRLVSKRSSVEMLLRRLEELRETPLGGTEESNAVA